MIRFDYVTLVTLLLPGSILSVAVILVIYGVDPEAAATAWRIATNNEWLATLVVGLMALLLGMLVSTAYSWVEEIYSDPRRQRELGLTAQKYEAEWEAYVDSLAKEPNPYVSRMVLSWRFESRTGAALALSAITLFFVGHGLSIRTLAVALFLAAVMLHRASERAHNWLAEYRHRHFFSAAADEPSLPNSRTLSWGFESGARERIGLWVVAVGARILRGSIQPCRCEHFR